MIKLHSTMGKSHRSGGRIGLLATAAALLLATASTSLAGVINASNVPVEMGTSYANLGFATITAEGSGVDATFHAKTVGAYTGFGIGGGYADAEIDLNGEKLTIEYAAPTVITELIFAFLYPNGGWSDVVNEIARVTVVSPTSLVGELTATGSTTATWTGSGSTVENLASAVAESGGVWRITNPFGSTAVQKIEFTAVAVGGGPSDSTNSDYGIVSISDADGEVPEPASAALTGLGLILATFGARKLRGRRASR